MISGSICRATASRRAKRFPRAFLIGEAAAPEAWDIAWRRIVSFKSYGPEGIVDLLAGIRVTAPSDPGGGAIRLAAPGTHVIAFESYQSENDLPAAEFTPYAEHEGLTPALAERARTGTTQARGRELYSRRAKALVQVGTRLTDDATHPIGQTLELVPERNPYALTAGAPSPSACSSGECRSRAPPSRCRASMPRSPPNAAR